MFSFRLEQSPAASNPSKIFLLVVLVFGLAAIGGGGQWLNNGSITIRQGRSSLGRRQAAQPRVQGPVVGVIEKDDLLYYPLCFSWIGLGVSMIVLSVAAALTSHPVLLRLSAYSLLLILLMAFGTVGTALLHGPGPS